MRGGGQRPHGAFPNIHAFWQGMASLTLVSDEDPVPLPGALHPGAVQGVVRLLLQLLKVKFKELEASIGAQFSSTAGGENHTLKANKCPTATLNNQTESTGFSTCA